mgnify:CR=1 FL=1
MLRCSRLWRLKGCLGLVLCSLVVGPAGADAPHGPQRIASLNLCLDQMLLKLVPRERIASVTYLSAEPALSPFAGQLRGIKLNHGGAEELLPLAPDLILAGDFGAREAVRLLERLGQPVVRLSLPQSLEDIRRHIAALGRLVGAEARADQLLAQLDRALARLSAHSIKARPRPGAFWYSANSMVAGSGTLENELMQRAGYRNVAAQMGLSQFQPLALERLLAAEPELLILSQPYGPAFSLAREYLEHPALARLDARRQPVPAALSGCPAPVMTQVIETLADTRPQS